MEGTEIWVKLRQLFMILEKVIEKLMGQNKIRNDACDLNRFKHLVSIILKNGSFEEYNM